MSTLPTGRAKLYWLIHLYLSDHHDLGTFCKEFETTFNFEVSDADLSREEWAVFKDLFDHVVMYSPFEDELTAVPFYKSAAQIRATAAAAISKLKAS
jgi:hypothetical protein